MVLLTLATLLFSSSHPVAEGGFDGFSTLKAIEKIDQNGKENWSFEFQEKVPRFQVFATQKEDELVSIRILVRYLKNHPLNPDLSKDLVRKSTLIDQIVAYPSIEEGDTAFEIFLSKSAQPLKFKVEEAANRLIVLISKK